MVIAGTVYKLLEFVIDSFANSMWGTEIHRSSLNRCILAKRNGILADRSVFLRMNGKILVHCSAAALSVQVEIGVVRHVCNGCLVAHTGVNDADCILLAKSIDGVYDSDPKVNPNAKKYDEISIQEVIDKQLGVVDLTASIMCMEHKMPMAVFSLNEKDGIANAMQGKINGTIVTV